MSMTWDGKSEVFVAAFQKNSREQVHVYLKEYEGVQIIDIRVWYEDRETGQFKPTHKGVAISTELYPALSECVFKIGELLDA